MNYVKQLSIPILVGSILVLSLFLYKSCNRPKDYYPILPQKVKILRLKDSSELLLIQTLTISNKALREQIKGLNKYINPNTYIEQSTTTKIDSLFIHTDSISYQTKFPISFQDSNNYYNIKGKIHQDGITISPTFYDTIQVVVGKTKGLFGKQQVLIRHSNKYSSTTGEKALTLQPKRNMLLKTIVLLATLYLGHIL